MAHSEPNCIVRPAKDLEEAESIFVHVITTLGWNRSPLDAETHWISASPAGFLVAVAAEPDAATGSMVEKKGAKPEGLIIAICYPNGTGWIGFFCVYENRQKTGWGKKLWDSAMELFGANNVKVIGLDAVKAQVGRYSGSGFVEASLVTILQRTNLTELPLSDETISIPNGMELFDLKSVPESWLIQTDLENSGLERSKLWTKSALFDRQDAYGFAFVDCNWDSGDANAKHEHLKGWILVRSCEHGFRIGPLYAETTELATALLRKALLAAPKDNPSASFIIESWPLNKKAVKTFEVEGCKAIGVDYQRMWYGGKVPNEQVKGGKGEKQCFAVFDAGDG